MRAIGIMLLMVAVVLTGCNDEPTAPRDLTPPAAPRGLYTVTGDQTVYLAWYANTESDVAGYRIYEGPCESGPNCPYDAVGNTPGTTFTLGGLSNGVTRYFAIAAYDYAGNESALTYETIFDTPRPEGFGAVLGSYLATPVASGWDFSVAGVRAFDDPATDMFYGANGTSLMMFVPDFQTDIQDAGYAGSLDAVDFAPNGGWSPTGSVELILGHCYVVWTRDNNYAKFRVTAIVAQPSAPPIVRFDWAYQVAPGNRELRARPARPEGGGRRPIIWLPQS
jgi:hypothetical protein